MADPLIYFLIEQLASAAVSFLIEQLASTAVDKIKQKARLVLELQNEVKQFTESLITIQAVLKDAEKRRVKEAVVQVWLDKLKEVAYEMDNVLDEWKTEALKQQIEKQESEGENALVHKKKVRFSIPSPSNCVCFGQGRQVVVCHAIALKIKDLNSRLTTIAEEKQRYEFQYTTTSGIEQPQRPKTSSLVDVSKFFGREHEKHTLISMLLGHSTSTGEEERGPLIIPVVGMGGMGKTTLAQIAFNDKNVKSHFKDFSKWICVSDPFDEIKITKTIIGGRDTSNSDELDDPMQSVSKFVEGKRFLLVLDDVWTEDDTKWQTLKLALMSSAKGSRILVTTRKETVARMMGATTHMIHLERLSEQNCLSLFYYIAFFNREKDKTDLFEAIGNKIVKKCNGLPLAVKTLGSLMCYKNTPKEWHDVLDSEMWEIKEVEQKVFHPLLLSYYDLTSEIKRCLLFCASFPKDYEIDKENLIELWMSQNYLNSQRNKEKRAIGQEYFDDLVMRSFFQDFVNDESGNLKRCKMHDIVHDFVQFLTRNECFIIEANGANQPTLLSSDSVYHLTLMLAATGRLSLPTPFDTCKKVRSLTIFNKAITTIDGDSILQLKCLRALNLSKNNVKEIPKEIGELLHLRYIDLSHNPSLKKLPDAMCNLCNLETLHLEDCGLEKLPKAMGKLINLKHLYVNDCTELYCLPKGLVRLTSLQILDRYTVVCGGDDNEILELGDLGCFEQLQGKLEIAKLGNVKEVLEAQKAQLEKKKHLLELSIDFGYSGSEEQQWMRDVEVLNVLRPHQHLKYLSIYYYRGTTMPPNWMMSLQHLTHLTLAVFKYCESLPPLGKLPYLEVLFIDNMRSVEKVGVEFLGIEETQTSPATAFPKLEILIFLEMTGWEEWEGVGDDCQVTIMPCLSHLYIVGAPNLKQLPDFLQNRSLLDLRWSQPNLSVIEQVQQLQNRPLLDLGRLQPNFSVFEQLSQYFTIW